MLNFSQYIDEIFRHFRTDFRKLSIGPLIAIQLPVDWCRFDGSTMYSGRAAVILRKHCKKHIFDRNSAIFRPRAGKFCILMSSQYGQTHIRRPVRKSEKSCFSTKLFRILATSKRLAISKNGFRHCVGRQKSTKTAFKDFRKNAVEIFRNRMENV